MNKYHDYILVQGHKKAFLKEVNEKMKSGHVLIGGVAVVPPAPNLDPQEDYFYQAMGWPASE